MIYGARWSALQERGQTTREEAMRAFLFNASAGALQAITIDQAGKNLPDAPAGPWEYSRVIDDVAKTGHDDQVQRALKDEGFWIRPTSQR